MDHLLNRHYQNLMNHSEVWEVGDCVDQLCLGFVSEVSNCLLTWKIHPQKVDYQRTLGLELGSLAGHLTHSVPI